MSLATWKKEFYPTSASRCSKKNALVHTIRKWTGLLKKNLRKHKCKIYGICLCSSNDEVGLIIGNTSCALCEHYIENNNDICYKCPLQRCAVEEIDPFTIWEDIGDARPMLAALRKAQKAESKKSK